MASNKIDVRMLSKMFLAGAQNLEAKKDTEVSEKEVEELFEEQPIIKTVTCPECGTQIQMAEGCFICLNCGYSGCS